MHYVMVVGFVFCFKQNKKHNKAHKDTILNEYAAC
jgi:hypothetical protein